jgi:hypothetical protein
MPVKRHLVGAGRLRDRLHPDGADSMPIKQIAGGRENPVARGHPVFLDVLNGARKHHEPPLDTGVTGQYLSKRYRSVPHGAAASRDWRTLPVGIKIMTSQQSIVSHHVDAAAVRARLLSPYRLGAFELKNRLVMSTRSRAVDGNVPHPLVATYYAQRAVAGLIVTEATQVSPQGVGYIDYPTLAGVAA